MAKITARGAHEVARVNVTLTTNDEDLGDIKGIFVLRSDRKLLRRNCGEYGGSYSIVGTLKAESMADPLGALRRIAAANGYIVTKEALA